MGVVEVDVSQPRQKGRITAFSRFNCASALDLSRCGRVEGKRINGGEVIRGQGE